MIKRVYFLPNRPRSSRPAQGRGEGSIHPQLHRCDVRPPQNPKDWMKLQRSEMPARKIRGLYMRDEFACFMAVR